MLMRKLALTFDLAHCTKAPKANQKKISTIVNLMELMDRLVDPYMNLVIGGWLDELATNAPMNEVRASEVDAMNVAAVMLLLITVKAVSLLSTSTCDQNEFKVAQDGVHGTSDISVQ
ncbi:hypothetical protein Dimus_018910 [Dionaea muscipula]